MSTITYVVSMLISPMLQVKKLKPPAVMCHAHVIHLEEDWGLSGAFMLSPYPTGFWRVLKYQAFNRLPAKFGDVVDGNPTWLCSSGASRVQQAEEGVALAGVGGSRVWVMLGAGPR